MQLYSSVCNNQSWTMQLNVILWLLSCKRSCVLSKDPKQPWNLLRASESKFEMIRSHLESQMSSSCLCPLALSASGWCGELAEQVRTRSGDIYHPVDYRAVTRPVWKSWRLPDVKKKRKRRKKEKIGRKNVNGDCITKLVYLGVRCFDGFTFGC